MARNLTNKVVAITGAARGIGLATAQAFLAEGARVAICDLDEIALKEASDTLGPDVLTATVDVTDVSALRGWIDQVEDTSGPLDVMVNNAGIMPTGSLLEESDALAAKTVEINILGVIAGTKRALETMVPRGRGVIVTLASMAGEAPTPGLATYNASKFGALGFTLATRLEVEPSGVDVFAVLPAFVNTDLTAGTSGTAMIQKVEPVDIAAAIVNGVKKPGPAKVYVPKSLGAVVQVGQLLPEFAAKGLMKLFKSDRVMLDFDREARRAYHERIGKE